jgi:predicted DCC family thiol-disulfide oxidoreductase YuxK
VKIFYRYVTLPKKVEPLDNNDLSGLIFLFARFWAHIEIIKREGLSVAISEDKRGKRLQDYLDCLESRRVRLIDRTGQRAIAETSLVNSAPKLIAFVQQASTDPHTVRWLEPLKAILVQGWHTTEKQKLLQYAAVLHSMIDTLDEKHLVTRKRPAIPNKLSQRSWRDLNYRVFGLYLKFVKDREKYLGPPKSGGPKGKAVRRNF